jgi:stress-induced morphogen
MDLKNNLKICIEKAIQNSKVTILDPREDGKHLEALVISDTFEKMPLIQRHQMVMDAVKDFFQKDLHALSIKTFTQNQFEKVNNG